MALAGRDELRVASPSVQWGFDQWLVTDCYAQTWRFWIVDGDDVGAEDGVPSAGDGSSVEGTSDGDLRGEPLSHIIYNAFDTMGALSDEPARDLIAVYDALTGADFGERVPRPTKDPRRLLRGFEQELRRVLFEAVDAGVLRIELHEVAWPFPEKEEQPPSKRSHGPAQEEETFFAVRLVDEAGESISGIDLVFGAVGETRKLASDGGGKARWSGVRASQASVQLASVAAAREKLAPRWKSFREPRRTEGEHVSVFPLRPGVAGASLKAAVEHTIALVPAHERVRLVGMHFDTSKCFLLPSAMRGIRIVAQLYKELDTTEFLVVGHTDAHGAAEYNKNLSLERAQAIVQYLRNDIESWNKWFTANAPEKRWGDREVNEMLSVLPEGEKPFGENPDDAVERFQAWSNETRGTDLKIDSVAGPKTRRELIAAYMDLDGTTLPEEAKVTAHGCGSNQPLPADEEGNPPSDLDLRRVDIFTFDGPVRPPPPGPTSGPGAPEYPLWVAQMASTEDVSAEVLSFRYALEVGPDQQWSEAAAIVLVSEDARTHQSFILSEGHAAGDLRIFEFSGLRAGTKYRAEIVEGEMRVELFGPTALHGVASESSPEDLLEPVAVDDAAPFDIVDDQEDFGMLHIRLYDADGAPMKSALYRLHMDGVAVGFAEDGVAVAPLPPMCPTSCTLEWGEPLEDGTLPYQMEVALDCDPGEGQVSSMLHNLGYPRSLDLNARVRAFQAQHRIEEHGLTPSGDVPPRTHAEIVRAYHSKAT